MPASLISYSAGLAKQPLVCRTGSVLQCSQYKGRNIPISDDLIHIQMRAHRLVIFLVAAGAVSIASFTLLASASPESASGENSSIAVTNEVSYNNTTIVTINGRQLVADLAITPDQQILGLSVKDSLAEDEAMLFIFGSEGRQPFWMHNMKFPIDIMWIDSNQNIVHIEHSLPPCEPGSACPSYSPDADSLYVLETVAGYAASHGIAVGTHVEIGGQENGISAGMTAKNC